MSFSEEVIDLALETGQGDFCMLLKQRQVDDAVSLAAFGKLILLLLMVNDYLVG